MAEKITIPPINTGVVVEKAVDADQVVAVEQQPVIVEPPPVVIPPNRPRKVYAGMWGPAEIGAVAVGLMTVLMSAVIYFFWVIPSNRELAHNRTEADRLEIEVMSANKKYGEITDTETQVARIVSSVDDFETRYLPIVSTGQSALYQRINGLIAAYDLVNTTGPDYAPLETAGQDAGNQTDEEKGRSKFRSLYPGVYVSTTVEGSYHNLRRFIREIETGREFIIVSAVELAPSDTERKKEPTNANPTTTAGAPVVSGPSYSTSDGRGFIRPGSGMQPMPMQPQQPQAKAKQGKMHGETVSLHIEMAAYFRRPNASPVTEQ